MHKLPESEETQQATTDMAQNLISEGTRTREQYGIKSTILKTIRQTQCWSTLFINAEINIKVFILI